MAIREILGEIREGLIASWGERCVPEDEIWFDVSIQTRDVEGAGLMACVDLHASLSAPERSPSAQVVIHLTTGVSEVMEPGGIEHLATSVWESLSSARLLLSAESDLTA